MRLKHGMHLTVEYRAWGAMNTKRYNKWRAEARLGGKSYFIGCYNTPEEATRARQHYIRHWEKVYSK